MRALTDLMELCKESANDKDWIVFESLVPLILEASMPHNNELKALFFSVLTLIVKDSIHGKVETFLQIYCFIIVFVIINLFLVTSCLCKIL